MTRDKTPQKDKKIRESSEILLKAELGTNYFIRNLDGDMVHDRKVQGPY